MPDAKVEIKCNQEPFKLGDLVSVLQKSVNGQLIPYMVIMVPNNNIHLKTVDLRTGEYSLTHYTNLTRLPSGTKVTLTQD